MTRRNCLDDRRDDLRRREYINRRSDDLGVCSLFTDRKGIRNDRKPDRDVLR
jgi:hypothetical protein